MFQPEGEGKLREGGHQAHHECLRVDALCDEEGYEDLRGEGVVVGGNVGLA